MGIRTKLGFHAFSLLLLLGFVMSYAKGGWILEATVITRYFPWLVALGAGATLTAHSNSSAKFAGNISYSLYMTHAVIWSFGKFYNSHKADTAHLTLVVSCDVLIMVALAYLVMVFYDFSVRRPFVRKHRHILSRKDGQVQFTLFFFPRRRRPVLPDK